MVIETTKEKAISIQGEAIEKVEQFIYLAGVRDADGNSKADAQRRIGCTSQAFGKINRI